MQQEAESHAQVNMKHLQRLQQSKQNQPSVREVRAAALRRYAGALQLMSRPQLCTRCGACFADIGNYGWSCRMHHPNSSMDAELSPRGLHSCCHSSADPADSAHYSKLFTRGCHRADHISESSSLLENTVLPCVLVDLGFIPLHPDAVVETRLDGEDVLESVYLVRRVSLLRLDQE